MSRSSGSDVRNPQMSSFPSGTFRISSLRLEDSVLTLTEHLTKAHEGNIHIETCYPLVAQMLDALSTLPVPPPSIDNDLAHLSDEDIVHKELTTVACFVVKCLRHLGFALMWLLTQLLETDSPPFSRFQELCKSWSIIFPWCRYIIAQIRHKNAIEEYSPLYTLIAKILGLSGILACQCPGLIERGMIPGTAGYLTILLRMSFDGVVLSQDTFPTEILAQAFFLSFMMKGDASQITNAVDENDAGQGVISGLAISHCMRHLVRHSKPNKIHMCELQFLSFLFYRVQLAYQIPDYFISRRTIRVATLVLSRVAAGSEVCSTKHTLIHESPRCRGECVLKMLTDMFTFLSRCAREGGSVAIAMMLKRNILKIMVRLYLACGINNNGNQDGRHVLSESLKPLLDILTIYLSSETVLRHLARSFRLRGLKKLEKRLMAAGGKPWKDWDNFRVEADRRIIIWFKYQTSPRREACHSDQARNFCFLYKILTLLSQCQIEFLLPQDVKRCAGCQRVFYCSKSCQKDDWKMHRSDCSELFIIRKSGSRFLDYLF